MKFQLPWSTNHCAAIQRLPMTASTNTAVFYPTGDGQPVAETFAHLYAILMTIEVLRLYLQGQRAIVLGNQFLYYEQGSPQKRIAPDVFVVFGVEPGGRDNFKIWEEGAVPSVVFEMTSPGTKKEDDSTKKDLYAQLGVDEYWQFDPKGEWIGEKLRGYRLERGQYQLIADNTSLALGLQLVVDDSLVHSPTTLIAFYRLTTGEKLLLPVEWRARAIDAQQTADAARQEAAAAEQKALLAERETAAAEAKNLELATKLAAYEARFGSLEEP
jgi:Uma2 family endonuclease